MQIQDRRQDSVTGGRGHKNFSSSNSRVWNKKQCLHREILRIHGERPKKKRSSTIGVAKVFDWGGGANHKSHAMTSSETSKENFLWGKDIVEWRIRSRGVMLARN